MSSNKTFTRLRGLFDVAAFEHAHVLVAGCGSGGSLVALQLVMSGVRRFTLIDKDVLKVENVIRHACGRQFLGQRKVDALEAVLRDRNPEVEVAKLDVDLMTFDGLEEEVSKATLVVLATDNEPSRWRINSVCVKTSTPFVVGRVFTRGIGGDVFAFRPDEDGCLACLESLLDRKPALRKGTKEIYYASEEEKEAVYGLEIDEIKDSPGLTVDISFIVCFHTRLALDALARELSRPELLDPIPQNYFIWGNRPRGPFADHFKIQRMRMPALSECTVCAE